MGTSTKAEPLTTVQRLYAAFGEGTSPRCCPSLTRTSTGASRSMAGRRSASRCCATAAGSPPLDVGEDGRVVRYRPYLDTAALIDIYRS